MPRANRYVLPGLVWHITHRCYRFSSLAAEVSARPRKLAPVTVGGPQTRAKSQLPPCSRRVNG